MDLLTSLTLAGTNHSRISACAEGEREHIWKEHVRRNVGEYSDLKQRARPAGVYKYNKAKAVPIKLVINLEVSGLALAPLQASTFSRNCIH